MPSGVLARVACSANGYLRDQDDSGTALTLALAKTGTGTQTLAGTRIYHTGDTTVSGWQLMGLKSGQMAGLYVPSPTIGLVGRFLDGVQFDEGAQYGYLDPRPRGNATTAVGLLMRMYLGWQHDHNALYRGVGPLPSSTSVHCAPSHSQVSS